MLEEMSGRTPSRWMKSSPRRRVMRRSRVAQRPQERAQHPAQVRSLGYIAFRNDAQRGRALEGRRQEQDDLRQEDAFRARADAAAANLKKRYKDAKAAKEAAEAENAARSAARRTHYDNLDDFEKNGPRKGKPKREG